jgi:hypothetical protein
MKPAMDMVLLKFALRFLIGCDSFYEARPIHERITNTKSVLPLDQMAAEERLAATEGPRGDPCRNLESLHLFCVGIH